MSDELKPCPFCGSDCVGLEVAPREHWPAVRCDDCGTLGPSIHTDHKAAMALWNVRSLTEVVPEAQKTLQNSRET